MPGLRFNSIAAFNRFMDDKKIKKPEPVKNTVSLNFTIPANRMNETEKRYENQVLRPLFFTKDIIYYEFEGVTFNLAGKEKKKNGCEYTPDFFIIKPTGIEIHEIKGAHKWEDSVIKYKWARDRWPWFTWKMVEWKDNDFSEVRI
jgi:hypothetical protein